MKDISEATEFIRGINETAKLLKKRPRVVVVFDNEAEYEEVVSYAKSKFLDVKFFLKFAAKAYMDKYPRNSGKRSKAVQPYA